MAFKARRQGMSHHDVIEAKASGRARIVTLAFCVVGLSLYANAGFAQQHLTPTGCDLNSYALGNAQFNADVNALAQSTYQNDAAKKYLTSKGNTVSAAGAPSTPGTSLSGTEASTSFMTELVAQRRVQEAQICPSGYEKIGGICQPLRRKVVQERVATSRTDTGTMTSLTRRSTTVPAPSAKPADFAAKPSDTQGLNAIWSEAFYDYERRTGLGSAASPASRSQQTSSLLFGADHSFQNGDTQLVLGALGSLTRIRQSFSTPVSNALQDTLFTVDLSNVQFGNYPAGSLYDYIIPTNHTISVQQQQSLSGGGGGLTASISRGGFFSDGIFKFDLLNLTRTTVRSETYARDLNIKQTQQANQGQAGCIEVVNSLGVPIVDPYSITGLRTTFTPTVLSTTASNFVIADTIGYHFAFPSGYWMEPLVGGSYSYSTYGSNAAALGLQDGQNLRLQGGLRLGLTKAYDRGIWTASLTNLAYSDVMIRGFVTNADGLSAGYLLADQGKLRLQSILSSKISFQNGLSVFLECQGRFGNEYLAYGGRFGTRWEF